jgi:hypothetical protein
VAYIATLALTVVFSTALFANEKFENKITDQNCKITFIILVDFLSDFLTVTE